MKTAALSLVVAMALLVAAPIAAGRAKMCPQLDGKQITVVGVVRNRMIGGQQEPGQAPSSYFDLENPAWKCKIKKVAVDYPGHVLWCAEGRHAEVIGTYHDASELLPGYYVIDATDVRCR